MSDAEFYVDGGDHTRIAFIRDGSGKISGPDPHESIGASHRAHGSSGPADGTRRRRCHQSSSETVGASQSGLPTRVFREHRLRGVQCPHACCMILATDRIQCAPTIFYLGVQRTGRHSRPTWRCQRTAPPHSSTGPRSHRRLHSCTSCTAPISSVAFRMAAPDWTNGPATTIVPLASASAPPSATRAHNLAISISLS